MFSSGNRYTVGCLIFTAICMLRFSAGSDVKYKDENDLSDARNDIRDAIQQEVGKRRKARDVTNCGSWSPWKNDNHPSLSQKEDSEVFTQTEINQFCPGGSIDKFECKDNNGEPFSRNITAVDGSYSVSCYDNGVTCKVLKSTLTNCPDMSIRHQCSCTSITQPVTTPAPVGAVTLNPVTTGVGAVTLNPVTTGVGAVTLNPVTTGVGAVTLNPVTTGVDITTVIDKVSDVAKQTIRSTLDIGDMSIPWWVFVLAVSGILFIINICVSICLYKKATNQFNTKRKTKTVHPLNSV